MTVEGTNLRQREQASRGERQARRPPAAQNKPDREPERRGRKGEEENAERKGREGKADRGARERGERRTEAAKKGQHAAAEAGAGERKRQADPDHDTARVRLCARRPGTGVHEKQTDQV